MTTTDAAKRVEEIENCSWDAECASGKETALYVDFIKYVEAMGIPELSGVASKILEVEKLKFDRW